MIEIPVFLKLDAQSPKPPFRCWASRDNRYMYPIRSNRLSLGAEHWVGIVASRWWLVKTHPAQAGESANADEDDV
jgi:hypothetical protein